MRHIFVPLLVLVALLPCLPVGTQAARTATYHVTNTSDSGPGSLRQAIIDTNNPGPDTIEFNIPSSDPGYSSSDKVWTITPASLLPSLTGSETIIDGATQTVNRGDTNVFGPEIRIDGSSLGANAWVFSVESNANQVLGLTINGADGTGVKLISGASGNIVKDNYIGVTSDGWHAGSNGTGVELFGGAHGNVIAHNVISSNARHGIMVSGSGTDGNMIRRNYIGLGWLGYRESPNGEHGILIMNGPSGNTVGGQAEYRNYIGANQQHGVYVSAANTNNVTHNYIGLSSAHPGSRLDVGNAGSGVVVDAGSVGTWIAYNVIAGNANHGVYLTGGGTDYNYVEANIFGANPSLTSVFRNDKHGVAIYDGAQNNEIGDAIDASQGNIIVGSRWTGVAIVNAGSDDNHVFNNLIGTDATGTLTDLGNGYYGVHVVGGAGNEIRLNHIAHNGLVATRPGVRVEGATATGNTISQNSIHDNSGKGIELADGGNAGVSTPSITYADCEQVLGSTGAGWTIEVFSDRDGEGRTYEGTTTAHSIQPAFVWAGSLGGPNVTVTATDFGGNTSEFSSPALVGWCHRAWLPLVRR